MVAVANHTELIILLFGKVDKEGKGHLKVSEYK